MRGHRHLLEPLCKGVKRIDDAVIVDGLVCVDRVVAATCAQDAVDQFCLGCVGRLRERVQKVLGGGLEGGGGIE